ncbi:hypothetical protein [Acidithrix ferrooxidans]|uniref:Uncharacterized protein n=1 Tax=Acidithrix ferrooxidans TaxID=1280514 RepID=A0A0D8HG76_9ACTN|nr:hypothetical protein [Acidithrix ferrooxidans]KJF16970.1 hypothetical protein AXFE_21720 [Acidithrix ferrooxidans]
MTNNSSELSDTELWTARLRLSKFIRLEAQRTATELGFSWRPASIAPSDLDALRAEFQVCHVSGLPLRVLRDFSEVTIYDRSATNWAFRYMHDTRHVWLSADFSTEAELAVASCHLARAKAEGLSPRSLEYELLLADTVGQTLYMAHTHRFVINQLQFALDCIRFDFDTALEREAGWSLMQGTAT